jgi:hypothetical protein
MPKESSLALMSGFRKVFSSQFFSYNYLIEMWP